MSHVVELLDKGSLKRVLIIRCKRWLAKLEVKTTSGSSTGLEYNVEFNSNDAAASFSDVLITTPSSYIMEFTNSASDITVTGANLSLFILQLRSGC